ARCLFEGRPGIRVARSERLALVERLRADFSSVIYPHQRCRVAALSGRQLVLRQVFSGHGALRACGSEYCADAPVEGDDEIVKGRHVYLLENSTGHQDPATELQKIYEDTVQRSLGRSNWQWFSTPVPRRVFPWLIGLSSSGRGKQPRQLHAWIVRAHER